MINKPSQHLNYTFLLTVKKGENTAYTGILHPFFKPVISLGRTLLVRDGLKSQLAGTSAASVSFGIHFSFTQIFRSTALAYQLVPIRLRLPALAIRKGLTEPRTAYLLQKSLEFRVPVAIAASANMQMVVAQFVLYNFLDLIPPVCFKLMWINLNSVTLQHISAAGCRQTSIKQGLVGKRNSEMIQRYLLNPLLQLSIIHPVPPPFSPLGPLNFPL